MTMDSLRHRNLISFDKRNGVANCNALALMVHFSGNIKKSFQSCTSIFPTVKHCLCRYMETMWIGLNKGRRQWKKNVFFRVLPDLPNPPAPMTPIRATWSSFFGSRNSRFESQFRTKNTIYTI